MKSLFGIVLPLALLASLPLRAELPAGPGRPETEKLCKNCHEIEKSVSLRQDRQAWEATLAKMKALGTRGTDAEFGAVLDYLAKHFPAGELAPLNINKATAIELESRLSLRRSQAAAVLAYRAKQGKIKDLEDLKSIPGLDPEKIAARKDQIVF
ncbi:MAG: hypothetical protein FJW20_06235 [Acidimicrobiia bacterium]|nr:hypothetical protein [Acidimicrobiia bacterium]